MNIGRTKLSLMIMIICIVLVAGCTTKPVLDNQTSNTTSPIASQTTQPSKALYKVTIMQTNNRHAEFIKMDSDIYNKGEIIEFYLVNEGSETLTCYSIPLSFQIYRQIKNNSWDFAPGTVQTKIDYVTYLKPGESLGIRRLITTDWIPGRYKIVSDCDGVSREFILRDIRNLTSK